MKSYLIDFTKDIEEEFSQGGHSESPKRKHSLEREIWPGTTMGK